MPFGTVAITWTKQLDKVLCDLVAEDCYSFGQIAEKMGLSSRNMVTSRWRRITADMGWQASWPTPAGPGPHAVTGEVRYPVKE